MLEVESTAEEQGRLQQLPVISLLPAKEELEDQRDQLRLPLLKGVSAPSILDRASRHSVDQVQRKLKKILQEEAVSEPIEESDVDEEFQRNIVENRKIIKLQKLKKEGECSQPAIPKKIKGKSKMDNRYERRMRQYRGTEVENKYLLKKKDKVRRDEDIERAMSQNKMNREGSMQNLRRQSMNEKEGKPMKQTAVHSTKLLLRGGRTSELLFDSIQNYLQNPTLKEKKVSRVLPALSKADLQSKLRSCEKKLQGLGMGDSDVAKSNFASLTVTEWKKLSVQNGQMNQHVSSFDREMERVNAYLQRNQNSLARYQANQGMLVEMQFIKGQAPKDREREKQQSNKEHERLNREEGY